MGLFLNFVIRNKSLYRSLSNQPRKRSGNFSIADLISGDVFLYAAIISCSDNVIPLLIIRRRTLYQTQENSYPFKIRSIADLISGDALLYAAIISCSDNVIPLLLIRSIGTSSPMSQASDTSKAEAIL